MKVNRRTQADRTAATRDALVRAARELFAQAGYAAVGTERIVQAAGVTRGALYHHFADKAALFAAVLEQVEIELTTRMGELLAGLGDASITDPARVFEAGAEAWLDACADPAVQQIVLLDGPAVLGWSAWREASQRHGMGLVVGLLEAGVAAGAVPPQPVVPLAHVLVGALDEAALYVAGAADPDVARAQMRPVLRRLVAVVTAP